MSSKKPNFNPKVSIIIPVYNGSNYLREAIDSALAQTYKNIEIIVVNDGSNDKGATEKIAKSYSNKIRYFKKENGGVATALNLGIEKMTGEYFSWLSHDDLYKPEKIEKQVRFLEVSKNKDIMIFSDFTVLRGSQTEDVVLDHKMLINKPKYSITRGCVNGITVMLPKSVIDKVGKFNPKLKYTQDYDYWMRVQDRFVSVHINETLTVTRIHSDQSGRRRGAVIEGDELWSRMIDWMSDSEKVKYEGSVYRFLLEMLKFIDTTPYKGAQKKCKRYIDTVADSLVKEISGSGVDYSSICSVKYMASEISTQRERMIVLKKDNDTLSNMISSLSIEKQRLIKRLDNIEKSKLGKVLSTIGKFKNKIKGRE